MNLRQFINQQTVSSEDVEDLLPVIERSLGFEFKTDELIKTESLNDICEIIISRLKQPDDDACTTLIAFNKLRNELVMSGLANKENIAPYTNPEIVFNIQCRIGSIEYIEEKINFKASLLKQKKQYKIISLISFIGGFISVFFFLPAGLILFLLSMLFWYLDKEFEHNYQQQLQYESLRDYIEDNVFENYLDFRKDKQTINRKELKKLMMKWFARKLGVDYDKTAIYLLS